VQTVDEYEVELARKAQRNKKVVMVASTTAALLFIAAALTFGIWREIHIWGP
jgi:hypothetical protein